MRPPSSHAIRATALAVGALALLGCSASRSATRIDSPAGGTAATSRQRQIERLQEFTAEKGFPVTGNFRTGSPAREAYFLCYAAGKWELPDSYDDLRYRESNTADCGWSESRYDIYLHRVEAVAFENTPVTEALESASDERALMVAAHEEAHEDPQLHRLPHPVAEAASTLLGMITAENFARREEVAETANRLSADSHLYYRKSVFVNKLHATLKAAYHQHRRGKLGRKELAALKQTSFAMAQAECQKWGQGHSINPCLPVANNAGLAFDHSYTREYPALYELYEATGKDYETFLAELRALGLDRARDAAATRALVRRRIAGLHTKASKGR